MNQINIIAVTDIEHSSPRITNLLYYLDNKKFNKYIVGANHIGFISKNDLPNNFFKILLIGHLFDRLIFSDF